MFLTDEERASHYDDHVNFLVNVQDQDHTYCQSCGSECEIGIGDTEDYCSDCLEVHRFWRTFFDLEDSCINCLEEEEQEDYEENLEHVLVIV